eukprot:SAG31_NODE_4_length_45662_cov_15.654622_15_plen_87_part_00
MGSTEATDNPVAQEPAPAPAPKKKKKVGMREAADIARAFSEIDKDNSGSLDAQEVRRRRRPCRFQIKITLKYSEIPCCSLKRSELS